MQSAGRHAEGRGGAAGGRGGGGLARPAGLPGGRHARRGHPGVAGAREGGPARQRVRHAQREGGGEPGAGSPQEDGLGLRPAHRRGPAGRHRPGRPPARRRPALRRASFRSKGRCVRLRGRSRTCCAPGSCGMRARERAVGRPRGGGGGAPDDAAFARGPAGGGVRACAHRHAAPAGGHARFQRRGGPRGGKTRAGRSRPQAITAC